jgi:glycogen synthase kinase 3 beta
VAELLSAGVPLFEGRSATDQMTAIVKVLGQPSRRDLAVLPRSPSVSTVGKQIWTLESALPTYTPSDVLGLLGSIFVYDPAKRPTAREILQHHCFDELFRPGRILPNGHPIPALRRSPAGPNAQ